MTPYDTYDTHTLTLALAPSYALATAPEPEPEPSSLPMGWRHPTHDTPAARAAARTNTQTRPSPPCSPQSLPNLSPISPQSLPNLSPPTHQPTNAPTAVCPPPPTHPRRPRGEADNETALYAPPHAAAAERNAASWAPLTSSVTV